MGLGLGCFGGAAAEERKVSPDARQSGEEGPEAKEQRRVVKEEKMQKGGDGAKQVAAGKKEKKRDYQKASIVIQHQFPFHSRPGLL